MPFPGLEPVGRQTSAKPSAERRIPEAVRDQIVTLALEEPELSPRELAVNFSDTNKCFVSEASVYRLFKSHDLITSPADVVFNHRQYPESIGNLTPTEVCFGRGETILTERRPIEQKIIQNRRLNHQRQAA